MASNTETQDNSQTRRELIKNAQLVCHQARSACLRLRNEVGDVPAEFRREFRHAIIDYYWTLRPLRSAAVIKNWWQSVKLSDHLTRTGTQQAIHVQGDIASPIQLVPAQEVVEEPLTGLDHIPELTAETTTEERTKNTIRGDQSVRDTVPKHNLPFEALVDLSATLDDAADKLGFGPETRVPTNDDTDPI